jgi:hypothetical protein
MSAQRRSGLRKFVPRSSKKTVEGKLRKVVKGLINKKKRDERRN